jgi:hypothetical protein
MQIPLIAKALLRRAGLERADGDEGQLRNAARSRSRWWSRSTPAEAGRSSAGAAIPRDPPGWLRAQPHDAIAR